MSAPLVSGGWLVTVNFRSDVATSTDGGRTDAIYEAGYDPVAPAALLPMRIREESHSVLVIAPTAAVRIRAVTGGGEVANGPVADGAARLRVPDPAVASYEALDASGKVIGRAGLAPLPGSGRPVIENWGFPQPFPAATP